MRIRTVAAMAVVTLWMGMMATSRAAAAVNLELRPSLQSVAPGMPVEITLVAFWDGFGESEFTIVDAALTWDPTVLALEGPAVPTGAHTWSFMFGFLLDSLRDGLNADCGSDLYCDPFTEAPFNDGDAFFQASSFSKAGATEGGLPIATFKFRALVETPLTAVVIEEMLGLSPSSTKVMNGLHANGLTDVTGTLQDADITIAAPPTLSVADVTVAVGRTAYVVVSGGIRNDNVLGIEVLLELVPRAESIGAVEFTVADDILQFDDPWPVVGTFQAFDIDLSGSPLLNGSIEDNGTFVSTPVAFSGDLAGYPLFASADAEGVWDVVLSTTEGESRWSLQTVTPTELDHGTVSVVDLGDGDGSGRIDLRDAAEFQACYTGFAVPAAQPAYSLEPALRCSVYDFDDDGDLDEDDHRAFFMAMSGPIP